MSKLHLVVFFGLICAAQAADWKVEKLDRGFIGFRPESNTVVLSWRLLAGDSDKIAFDIRREGKKLNPQPLATSTHFTDTNAPFNALVYSLFSNGKEVGKTQVTSEIRDYIPVPLKTLSGYRPNDGSVGDLDGDGTYEIVLHQAGRGRDNSHAGFTDPPVLEAYRLDGKFLWRINLGKNIREGAHYTQFLVYDFDGDGRAEVMCKTADGTVDGTGNVIGNAEADWREREGRTQGKILKGPEYLTVFDGKTGAAVSTTNYLPSRGNLEDWGDNYGNRADRFLACVAYLDGKTPSAVFCRGYYAKSVLVAWKFQGGKLLHEWTFDSAASGNSEYAGQGNHNLSVADVDDDGRDEIIYGAAVIDDNGKGLHSTGFGHGDALHVSDLDPDKPGLEILTIQEKFSDAGVSLRNAATGKIYWKKASVQAGPDGEGPARGLALDIDPRHPGHEAWVFGAGITGLFNSKGEKISERAPRSCNFGLWWDGDLLRELLNRNYISKWNWETSNETPLLIATNCAWNNGSKGNPVLSADIVGDWREEVIWRTQDNKELRIYSTPHPTSHRLPTLMHDRQYRLSIAWQNVGYNQPPHPSFTFTNHSK